MNPSPNVSVIIPAFNAEATIAAAIESALGQRFDGSFEVVVINDGSTDDTARVAAGFGPSVSLVNRAAQGGVAAATNAGVRASHGRYLAFLHADDTWMSDKLARTVPLLESDREAVLVYHDASEVDDFGRLTKRSHYPAGHDAPATHRDLLENRAPSTLILVPTVVMRRATYDECGGFAEDVGCTEDLWMWILASELGRFRFVPEVLACRRFSLSERREQWYLDGVRRFERAMRQRYGRAARGNYLNAMLVCFGLVASARGDRRKARGYYLEALRRNPASVKTWLRLAWTVAPVAVTGGLARSMPASMRQSLNGPPRSGVFAFAAAEQSPEPVRCSPRAGAEGSLR
jgi:glycosyltransferase involved in cell wall biosynthesis